MKTKKQISEEVLVHGQASLDKIMETLKPFLPPQDNGPVKPACDWKITDQVVTIQCGNIYP